MTKIESLLRRFAAPAVALLLLTIPAIAGVAPPTPDVDAWSWARTLYQAAVDKQWGVVSGLALVGVVYAARRWAGQMVPWFRTELGGISLAFLISLGGTIGLAAAAGAPITAGLVVSALTTATTAAGIWEWLKSRVPGVQEAADRVSVPRAVVVR